MGTMRRPSSVKGGLLGTNDVAELLQVHPKHVYRLLKRGLPSHRVGGEWRFDTAEVLAWVREGRTSPRPAAADSDAGPEAPMPPLIAANGDVCIEVLLGVVAEQNGAPIGFVQADRGSASTLVEGGRVLAAGVHGQALTPSGENVHVKLARRTVGLAYGKKKLRRLADIEGAKLASRPATAGVRGYLDEALRAARLDPEKLHEHALLCGSHRDVVLALVSGHADAGLVSLAWAHRAGLGFLPLVDEDYSVCLKATSLTTEGGRALIRALQSPALRRLLGAEAGYDAKQTGTLCV